MVLFVVDTSGSMGARELACADPEARGLVDRGADVTVMQVDARVTKVQPYNRFDSLTKFAGRGGTDFRPAFAAIETMQPRPDFVVYFTDGMGAAPAEQTIDTLWVLTDTGMSKEAFQKQVCSWGDVTILPTGDKDA